MAGATDTIFALASGGAPAGVAVVRVSGPNAADALSALIGTPLPKGRRATLRTVRRPGSPASEEPIDRALVLWFAAPKSFTGEDVAELHLHGGRAVIEAVLDALGRVDGCRMALAGEFTRRAFDNGKLDLTQVEGLADLVYAETEAQRRQAQRALDGHLAAVYEKWRAQLVELMAHLEASIDFADEELPDDVAEVALAGLEPVIGDLAAQLADGRAGEILRDGLSVVILGAPNAGKSSILNQLAQRDAAIVSARAGTTRDVIDVHLSIAGYPVIVTDTAGLREAGRVDGDEIEREGMRRARERAAAADLRLIVFDATRPPDPESAALVERGAVIVLNKADLLADAGRDPGLPDGLLVSAQTGAGVGALVTALGAAAEHRLAAASDSVIMRARHREAIEDALAAMRRARAGTAPELIAEDLRLAARALGRVTGRVDVEDLLDVIFRDFCIGK